MKDAQEEEEGREKGAGLSGLAGSRPSGFDMGAALARGKKRGVACHCHVNAQTRQKKRGVRAIGCMAGSNCRRVTTQNLFPRLTGRGCGWRSA